MYTILIYHVHHTADGLELLDIQTVEEIKT